MPSGWRKTEGHIYVSLKLIYDFLLRIKRFVHLFDEIDASLKVEPEVDEGPLDALPLVLLLLQDEHVVVEILLQFLICEVDAKLLEAVELR